MNAWASGPDDVWVVGGTPDRGVVLHYDGNAWRMREPPAPVPLLNWVYGFGPDDVWIVGSRGTVLHWHGGGFTTEDAGTREDLWGVWGPEPGRLWVVGGSGFPDANATLVERREGEGWRTVELPPLSRPGVHGLFKVWGNDSADVWVVGQRGVILRHDGTSWREHPSGVGEDLIAVWGAGRDRIAIVGGRSNGVLLLWDGAELRRVDLDFAPGINGVWMRHHDRVHIAGVLGTLRAYDWSGRLVREDDVATRFDFHSIHGTGEQLLAVGGSLSRVAAPHEGLAWSRPLRSDE
ncbi:MAG: hypothetical protein NZ898_06055 [Myxococcota bacterium]|nr:hypothetical protein [Myxococcota bacterium]